MTNHIEHLRDQVQRIARIIEELSAENVGPVHEHNREAWEAMIQAQLEDLRDVGHALSSLAKF